MLMLRRLLLGHRAIAALLVALALTVRALVPAGTMPQARHIAVTICSESTGQTVSRSLTIPAKPDPHGGVQQHQGTCAFASLAMAASAGDNPPDLPAPPLAPVARYHLPQPTAPPALAPRLLPPLRGPPLQA